MGCLLTDCVSLFKRYDLQIASVIDFYSDYLCSDYSSLQFWFQFLVYSAPFKFTFTLRYNRPTFLVQTISEKIQDREHGHGGYTLSRQYSRSSFRPKFNRSVRKSRVLYMLC